MANLKLDDFEKNLIEEISVLVGLSPTVVREVLEATLLRQIEFLLKGNEIYIPFLGKLFIRYVEDEWIAGAKSAKVDAFFSASDLLKRFVGEINEGDSPTLKTLMKKKIQGQLQSILDK
jgi:hypothetical protein